MAQATTQMQAAQLPEIDMAYDCDVYAPSDDTFLFLDSLQDEMQFLVAQDPLICVEIGCGSGAVISFLAQQLAKSKKTDVLCIASDVNREATQVTTRTGQLNGIKALEVVQMDLLGAVESRLTGTVDILLFNPPYVPTPSEEVGSNGITAAWAGGHDGREVIDRVLPKVKQLLSPTGVFYMVVVAENKPKEIAQRMAQDGFKTSHLRAIKAQNERLAILKFSRAE